MESISSLIPTDNLYRFLSISGILIFGFCFFYPDYRSYQIIQKQITLATEEEILDIKIKAAREKVSNYSKEIKRISAESAKNFDLISRVSKLNISKLSNSEIKRYKYLLLNNKKQLIAKSLEMDSTIRLLKNLNHSSDSLSVLILRQKMVNNLIGSDIERLHKLNRVALIGQITGIAMSIIGFGSWFLFIQLPQDKLLSNQVNDANKVKNDTATGT